MRASFRSADARLSKETGAVSAAWVYGSHNSSKSGDADMQNGAAQKITPFLWFDGQAEEAAKFYTSIFKNSKILGITPMSARFELEGQRFFALNGGPKFKFTPAISFFVDCKDQKEVDDLWEKLSAGGEILQCGWLTDKFGVTWQIIPSILGDMLQDEDEERSGKVMQAMLQMTKIEIKELEKAYNV
jgi:predicted 3-demethylubiquinone-9 3-methyltransferase (glyoxalase superfamily)